MRTNKQHKAARLIAERTAGLADRRRRAYHQIEAATSTLSNLRKALDRIDRDEAELAARGGDVPVLLRGKHGAARTRYHNAERPCGMAWGRGFPMYFEGEVVKRHPRLKRCSACHWPSPSAQESSAA